MFENKIILTIILSTCIILWFIEAIFKKIMMRLERVEENLNSQIDEKIDNILLDIEEFINQDK